MLDIYWERENPIGSLPPRSPAPGSSVAPTGHGLRPGSLTLRSRLSQSLAPRSSLPLASTGGLSLKIERYR